MTLPTLTQSPLDDALNQNPYPFYDRMRALGPLVHWSDYGFPCASHFATVNALLRDRRFGREAPPGILPPVPPHLKPFYDNEAHSMLEREPPTHTRLRGQVLRAFTSRKISAFGPEIGVLSHQLIDAFEGPEVDLLSRFAQQIPVIIIARLLGVPEGDADQLLDWSHAMVAMYEAARTRAVEDRAVAATLAFTAYLRDQIAACRKSPRDDLISTLIAATDKGEKLSEEELISTCILILNAGHEATVHAIGNGVKAVLESGQSPADLFQSDMATEITVEEILRFDPPLHMFTRYAMEPVTIYDHDFKTGDQVGLLLGAANRDPARFPAADRFDVTRGGVGQLGFGGGLHFCVGAPLARLEMTQALPVLFARHPKLRLAAPPRYTNRYHFHGLEALRVAL